MKLKTQHNNHFNNHRYGTRGQRFRSKLRLSSKFIRYGQSETDRAFAQILLEETERYLPVIDENEKTNIQDEEPKEVR